MTANALLYQKFKVSVNLLDFMFLSLEKVLI